jgi:hypothetical protein
MEQSKVGTLKSLIERQGKVVKLALNVQIVLTKIVTVVMGLFVAKILIGNHSFQQFEDHQYCRKSHKRLVQKLNPGVDYWDVEELGKDFSKGYFSNLRLTHIGYLKLQYWQFLGITKAILKCEC